MIRLSFIIQYVPHYETNKELEWIAVLLMLRIYNGKLFDENQLFC